MSRRYFQTRQQYLARIAWQAALTSFRELCLDQTERVERFLASPSLKRSQVLTANRRSTLLGYEHPADDIIQCRTHVTGGRRFRLDELDQDYS